MCLVYTFKFQEGHHQQLHNPWSRMSWIFFGFFPWKKIRYFTLSANFSSQWNNSQGERKARSGKLNCSKSCS